MLGQMGHPPQPGGHESISGTSRRKNERTQKGTPASGGLVGGWGFTLRSSDFLNNKFLFAYKLMSLLHIIWDWISFLATPGVI